MRRIGSLAIAVAAFGLSLGAQADDQVTLRLNWILYGFHTPFHLGVERGFYKDEGIDLTIGDGQGSGRTVQVVAAGGDTFGVSDAGSVIAGAAKGAPIRSVMAVTNSSPYAVGVRGDLGAKSAKDLAGMTIAATPGEAGVQLWPAVLAANGMAPDATKFLMVDGPGKMVAVLEKRTEAVMAGLDNQCLIIPARGMDLTCLKYADMGANTVGLTVHTRNDLIESNPDLVRRFVRASVKAFDAAMADPDASIAAGMKVKPDAEKDLWRKQLDVGISLMKTPATKGLPTGTFAESDWQDTLDLMKKYQGLETDKPVTAFFTNEFLPK